MPPQVKIPVSQFKARCLSLLKDVARRRLRLIVTKRGKPVARVEPPEDAVPSVYGWLQGTVEAADDLTKPLDIQWEALRKRRRSSSTRVR